MARWVKATNVDTGKTHLLNMDTMEQVVETEMGQPPKTVTLVWTIPVGDKAHSRRLGPFKEKVAHFLD